MDHVENERVFRCSGAKNGLQSLHADLLLNPYGRTDGLAGWIAEWMLR